MVIYQFSNTETIVFTCLFIVLIVTSIVIGIICLPMLKLIVCSENSIKPKILLSFICVPIYILCVCGLVFGFLNVAKYGSSIQDTRLENCMIQKGEISEIVEEPQLSRGADIVSYHVKFTVEGSTYFINKDIGVCAQDMEHWKVGTLVTIYYHQEDDMNVVIRVEK